MSKPTALFVVNELQWFWSHRLPIGEALRARGWRVIVAAPPSDFTERVRTAGFDVETIALPRTASARPNPRAIAQLVAMYRRLKPDLVHHVTIRPVLYGGIAGRIARLPAVVNAIAGFGSASLAGGLKGRVLRSIVANGMRVALAHHNSRVIVQNPDDRAALVGPGIVPAERVVMIRGAGVDTNRFTETPIPHEERIVVYIGRLLWDKGVGELIEASRILRQRGVQCRVWLVGEPDPANPTNIPEAQVRAWRDEGLVEWLGQRWDVENVIAQGSLVVLPSYREGLPKALLEGAACGRPLVAFDVPGSREVIEDGVNGLLVPARDANALADAIALILNDNERASAMGRASRALAVREFSQERVVAETLRVYDELLAKASPS